MTSPHRTLAPLAALALALGACGSDDEPAAAPPQATPTAAAAMPYGTYTRTVTKADIARTAKTRKAARQEAGANMELPPVGEYRLVLSQSPAGDIVDNIGPDGLSIQMYGKAEAGALTLEDYVDPGKGAFCGPEVAVDASYSFEVDGDVLRLQPDGADPCADRDTSLTGDWERQ